MRLILKKKKKNNWSATKGHPPRKKEEREKPSTGFFINDSLPSVWEIEGGAQLAGVNGI